MKAKALMALLVLATAVCGVAQEKKSAGFDPKRDAAKDIENAIVKAKKESKRILLDVGGEW